MALDRIATVFRTAGEPHRLRILALCASGDLSASELTRILGLSQPSMSRHLRLLCDAGLLQRHQEGNWAFFHFPTAGTVANIAHYVVSCLDPNDSLVMRDRRRLLEIQAERAAKSQIYFRENAQRWDQIRALHVEERQVESTIRALTDGLTIRNLIDIGTGTGRMLQLFADRASEAIGIDRSPDMLSIARVNLSEPRFSHCSVRHGDMYSLPFDLPRFDLATLHMVLHFAEKPQDVIAEAARVVQANGHLLIVDFAPHSQHQLLEEHAHLRLGFDTDEVETWAKCHDLKTVHLRTLAKARLAVNLWLLRKNQSNASAGAPSQIMQ